MKVKQYLMKIDRCMGGGRRNIDPCPFHADTSSGIHYCIKRRVRRGSVEEARIPYESDDVNNRIITSIPDWCPLDDYEE